jgi:hypothetical protein
MLGSKTPKETIRVTALIPNSDEVQNQVKEYEKISEDILKIASGSSKSVKSSVRIEKEVGFAIQKIVKENFITHILLKWENSLVEKSLLRTSTLDKILESTTEQLTIIHLIEENDITKLMTSLEKIIVTLPEFIHLEIGFRNMIRTIKILAKELKLPIEFYCSNKTEKYLTKIIDLIKPDVTYTFHEIDIKKFGTTELKGILTKESLYIPVFTRKGTISWNKYISNGMQKIITTFPEINIMTIYPETTEKKINSSLDILQGGIPKSSFSSYGDDNHNSSTIFQKMRNFFIKTKK